MREKPTLILAGDDNTITRWLGPVVWRQTAPYDFKKFDEVLRRLQAWRDADHEDNLVLYRTHVIEIIEGVKALRDAR
jgi:hypothetical protein